MADSTPTKLAIHAVLRRDKKVFMLLRSGTGWQDGVWSTPSGKVEADETLPEAVVRELNEEIGITVSTTDVRVVHVMYHTHDIKRYVDVYFEVQNWQGEPYNAEPHMCAAVGWFDEAQRREMPVVPGVVQALALIPTGQRYSEYHWS